MTIDPGRNHARLRQLEAQTRSRHARHARCYRYEIESGEDGVLTITVRVGKRSDRFPISDDAAEQLASHMAEQLARRRNTAAVIPEPGRADELHFHAHVSRRLAQGARDYEDRSYDRPVAELLIEISEEAADIAAWGQIARTVATRSDRLTSIERQAISGALQSAEAAACYAWRHVNDALGAARASEG